MDMKKLLVTLTASAFVLGACEEPETTEQETESVEEVETLEEETTEVESDVSEESEDTEEPEETTENLPEELQDLTVTDTRGDTTGNWRKVVTPANVNMPENALTYFNEYMEEGEVHHIISFATNTTTLISDIGGTLYVDITEYEEREEHSADTIGGGMLLQSFIVYKENGEIEEIE
jgi:hypothetical protein